MTLPTWLQKNNSFKGIKYGKLEDRDDYQEIKERREISKPANITKTNKTSSALPNKTNPLDKYLLTTNISKPVASPLDKYSLSNKNLPISKQAPKKGYDKFKEENPNTPSFLQPLGYVLNAPYRFAPTQRLLTKTSEFLGAKSLDQKGNQIKSMSTGNKILDSGIDIGGMIMGSAFTGASSQNLLTGTDAIAKYGGGKVASTVSKLGGNKKFVNSLANGLGTYGRGAIDAGASTAIEGMAKGKDLKETAKNTAINSVFGGAMFVGGKAIGDTVQGIKSLPKVSELNQNAYDTKFGKLQDIKKIKVIPIKTQSPQLNGKFTVKNTALDKAQNEYNEAIETIQNHFMTNKLIPEEISRIKPELGIDINKLADNLNTAKTNASKIGDNARLRTTAGITNLPNELQRPLKTATNNIKPPSANVPLVNNNITIKPTEAINTKTSEFKTNTLRNSEFLADKETQKVINSIAVEYEVKPNMQTMNRAVAELTNDFDGVVNRIKNTEIVSGQGALNSAEDAASSALITRQLRIKAKETGDYTEVKAWLEVLQPKVTNTAQSLQALKTWKDLSPEGTIFKAQQVVGEVNRAGVKTYGKNFTPIELSTNEIKHISDSMEDVIKMPETTPAQIKAKEREFAKVKKVIGDKVPATLADKVKALQRISLLLNPKTNVRNVLGNTILGTLENTKDIISAPLDKLVSLNTGQRTTLLPSLTGLQTQGKGMVKGVKTVIGDAKAGVNTSQSRGQFEISGDRIFRNNTLNKLDTATNTALRLGDEPFYQAAYDESLRQQLKIAKATEPTKDMLAKAKEFAEDRTLQNTSAMSEGFKGLQKSINKLTGNENLGIGTFAVPFAKTPANILDKAIDYTPVGSLKAITQLMTKKTFNQKQFVDRIGRSIVGTGIIALGYDLAKDGKLTGNANKDKDVAALDRQMGKSPYAFVVDDEYKTFDWASPASIPLAIGADIFFEGKTRDDMAGVAVDAFKNGATTLFKQSLLQGFQRLFGYNDLIGGLTETAMNAPTQFIPTVLKQASQLKDSSLKDTYDPDRFKKLGNQIKAKIPLVSEKLPTKVDTLGRDMKQFQGKNNAFNVLVNPSFTTKNVSNETEKFVSKLYEETGLKTHFPKVAENKITYKVDNKLNQTINLTADEKIALQRYIGQRTDKEFQAIAKQYEKDNSNTRTMKSATTQVKELGNLLSDIYADGEKKILEARGIQEYNKKTFGKTIGNNPRN